MIRDLLGQTKYPLITSAIGLGIYAAYPETWPLVPIVKLFAEALVVGSVIAFTLETFVSHILVEHAAQHLADKLVGMGLPTDLQGVIGDIVHRTTLVHHDSSITYDIQENPADPQKVYVLIDRQWKVRNYGKNVEEYCPRLGTEHFYEPIFLSLDCSCGEVTYAMKSGEFEIKHGSESRGIDAYGRTVRLPPYNPKMTDYDSCHVRWRVRMTMPRNYSDVTVFSVATVGGFEVRLGSIPDGFEFDARRIEGHTVVAEHGTVWRYTCAFIRRQHIKVWWRPRAV